MHGEGPFGRGLGTFGPLPSPHSCSELWLTPNPEMAVLWCAASSAGPPSSVSLRSILLGLDVQVSYGRKGYLHHKGKIIPEDFQQQHGLQSHAWYLSCLASSSCCCKSSWCLVPCSQHRQPPRGVLGGFWCVRR